MSKKNEVATIPVGYGVVDTPITLPEDLGLPYVKFISKSSPDFAKVAGLLGDPHLDGWPVLYRPKMDPIKLDPMRYFLVRASEYWAQFDQSGNLVGMSRTRPESVQTPRFDQVIETAILVLVKGDGLVPSQCSFKSTKCPAVYPAIRALVEANDPAWFDKGPDYAFTRKIKEPLWGRFTVTATKVDKANRTTGKPYPTMDARINPITTSELDSLMHFKGDAEAQELLKRVENAYLRKVQDARTKELQAA